jgi:hypothetical protein
MPQLPPQRRAVAPAAAVALLLLLPAMLLPGAAAAAARLGQGEVIELRDDNFDSLTMKGIWLVDIYAPWCVSPDHQAPPLRPTPPPRALSPPRPLPPSSSRLTTAAAPPRRRCTHCQKLEPVWRELARDLRASVNVAKADGTRNRVLLMRFGVEAYPSIFLLWEGKTWQYDGARSVDKVRGRGGGGAARRFVCGRGQLRLSCAVHAHRSPPSSSIPRPPTQTLVPRQLKEFALGGYKAAKPLPFHKSPVSAFGRVMGALHSLPALAKQAYTHLKVHARGGGPRGAMPACLHACIYHFAVTCNCSSIPTHRSSTLPR